MIVKSLILIFAITASLVAADVNVTSMPQWPSNFTRSFNMFAGYTTKLLSSSKQSFYVFITSMNNPSTDPLILWLNGGPGCSSLSALVTEIGPFVLDDGQLNFTGQMNPYAWNKIANILFLESPAGVGYSKANVSAEKYDDNTTMVEQYLALLEFYTKYPQYVKNKLWIAGEGYAGIYVPNLANYIIQQNSKSAIKVPLAGIIVGNPITTLNTRRDSAAQFYYEYNMIPQDVYNSYKVCSTNPNSPSCIWAEQQITKLTTNLNTYDIYRPCQADPVVPGVPNYTNMMPCTASQGAINYFNLAAVKTALGVDSSTVWTQCNYALYQKYVSINDTVNIYKTLKANSIRILVYSGDTDSKVPTLDTLKWIVSLGWKPNDWNVWNITAGTISGFVQKYDGLTFATIKGAGHMAPAWKREEAYYLFSRFIQGQAPFEPPKLEVEIEM